MAYITEGGLYMHRILAGTGVLMLLVGVVWLLQGIGVLPGSFMTGQSFWATMGLILIVGGAAACFFGLRRRPANPRT